MSLNLRTQIFVTHIAIIVGTTVGFGLLTVATQRDRALEHVGTRLQAQLAVTLTRAGDTPVERLTPPGDTALTWIGPRGAYPAAGTAGHVTTDAAGDAAATITTPDGTHVPAMARSAPARFTLGGVTQSGRVVIAERTTPDIMAQLTDTVITLLAWIILASVLGALAVSRDITRDLEALATTARATARDDFTARARRDGPQEVRAVADALNAMIERLGQAFETQRSFSADISHEIRTPLTAIRGHAELLLLAPSHDAVTRASLESIVRESARLTRLTEDMLYLSRSEEGELELRRTPADVHTTLQAVAQMLGRPELVIDAPSGLAVEWDDDAMRQVILNLVTNALRADARTVTLRARRAAGTCVITVEDDGCGIDPQHLPHIFRRLYRVDHARTAGRGSGLGLSIARATVRRHGGDVTVTSQPGRGSTFTITVPDLHSPAAG